MSDELALPDLPDVTGVNPQLLTAPELRQCLEQLFGWLQAIDAAPDSVWQRPGFEASVESVREVANMLLQEQRERHFDETAPRGG